MAGDWLTTRMPEPWVTIERCNKGIIFRIEPDADLQVSDQDTDPVLHSARDIEAGGPTQGHDLEEEHGAGPEAVGDLGQLVDAVGDHARAPDLDNGADAPDRAASEGSTDEQEAALSALHRSQNSTGLPRMTRKTNTSWTGEWPAMSTGHSENSSLTN